MSSRADILNLVRQSGEVYFDEAEVETIQKIIRTVDDQTEKMAVSV